MKRANLNFFLITAALSILLIVTLATGYWRRFVTERPEERQGTVIITPNEINSYLITGETIQLIWDESLNTRAPMEETEAVIAVINRENIDGFEEQFVAFVNSAGVERRVNITYINYDETSGSYKRRWNAPTAITRPETLSFFDQDIIGDRNNCIIAAGMNINYEHTMTVLRRDASTYDDQVFNIIAELQIDGSIIIQEEARSLAYQQGIARGQSFNISTYGQDSFSNNILDQIETIYSYNPVIQQYEQTGISRIPGSRVEQQELSRILNGNSADFENFINDLWYYVSPQGTIDLKQYIYFDPSGREIIFYGDDSQQVFVWLNSVSTRYGLYITSQNISISTLRRRLDIELESLESIRLRVSEDVRLTIQASESWDGSYRRASSMRQNDSVTSIKPLIDASYDSSWGRIQFDKNGEYTISSGSATRSGRYIFYEINGQELLEMRSKDGYSTDDKNDERMIYRLDNAVNGAINLSHIRLGTSGVQDLFDPAIVLIPVGN